MVDRRVLVAVAPEGVRPFLVEAVEAGGGEVVPVESAEALVWADPNDAGGLAESLLRLLGPFGCDITVVRGTPRPMAGATRVVPSTALDEALTGADVVVLALPLTPGTVGLIDRRRLDLLAPGAALVNVAR